MSRRHADNWSHLGHYLVDPYTWPWSQNGHGHGHEWPTATLLCNVNRPSHFEIQLFQNLTMKIHGQDHVCGQRSRSCLTSKIQRSRLWSRSNPLVTFEAWSSVDVCFSFRGNQTISGWDIANSIFDLDNSTSRSWPRSNPMITFGRLSSLHMFAFCFVAIRPFFGWYSKFYIWPWKI